MVEHQNLIGASLALNPVQHVVSAGTISAGVTGKMLTENPVNTWEYIVSLSSDFAIVVGLILTCVLVYRAFRADQIDRLSILKLKIEIAEKGRRVSDKSKQPSDT